MTALDQERCANAVLRTCRDRTEPALRAAIDSLPDPMRLIAGYHRGWWDEHGKPTRAGGKAIRPALALLSGAAVSPAVGPADSPAGPGDLPRTGPGPVYLPGTGPGPVGGAADRVVPAAVAVELVHDFSLLHDDVMDRDATRRHRPTAWAVFGVGEAILAGDALLTLALDVLARSGHPAASEGIRLLSDVVQELVDGQVSDLAFERRDDVGLAECLRMAEAKTGALLGGACALGARFAGAPAVSVRRMRRFGRELGLAFQLVDDLLGIWGDPATTGKPARSDLRCRKKSLPVVAALTSGTSAGQRFGELYGREGELSEADLVLAAELIELAGGRSWCRDRADILATQAMHRLPGGGASPGGAASSASTELGVLARLILDRDH
jgi:geranylgeranyl diphosphate synthase type I